LELDDRGVITALAMEAFRRERPLHALDEIALTSQHKDAHYESDPNLLSAAPPAAAYSLGERQPRAIDLSIS
jgi:hypothetical protein